MKTLYLLRHAKSSWDTENQSDELRPLKKRGRLNARSIGRYMRFHDLQPQSVLCSPALRCQETWDILAPYLDNPPMQTEGILYTGSSADLMTRITNEPDDIDHLMLIGHNPSLAELAIKYSNGANPALRQDLITKYPTGTLAVLKFDCDHWTDLKPYDGYLQRVIKPRLLPR